MKAAFLSDIHANRAALETALDLSKRLGAERVYVAGDIAGRGPDPAGTIELLKEKNISVIRGNVERKLLNMKRQNADFEGIHRKKKANLAWTALQLGAAHWRYLESLPETLSVTLGGILVSMVYGSPKSDHDYIFPSITEEGLFSKLNGNRPALLVCGHSHIPFTKILHRLRVVNCGACGLSIDGDPRPSFCLVDINPHATAAEDKTCCRIVRFKYDIPRTISELTRKKVPSITSGLYTEGIQISSKKDDW